MKRNAFLRWSKWLFEGTSIRQPAHRVASSAWEPISQHRLSLDAQSLQQIAHGLKELEQRVRRSEIISTSDQRGYLTPEEDDRVRNALLAYRNYRLALYEIILRYERYMTLRPARVRLKAFLLAYAAAVTLYARSLELHELARTSRLVRAKLNEPEPKFDLEEGFFDDVMAGYCSLRNYGSVLAALWFWTTRRRRIRRLTREEPDPWGWVEQAIVAQRKSTTLALKRVLRSKWKFGWSAFWQTAFRRVDRASYRVRSRMGGRFAGVWLHPTLHQPLDDSTLRRVRSHVRPGDVLLMRAEGKLTTSILPGFWAHAALYLGTRRDVEELNRHLGVTLTEDRFGYVIEAVSPCVRVASLRTCLDADHLLVLRPNVPTTERTEALTEALRHLHKPYDFEFDFNLSSRLVCTGLVYRSYQGRGGIEFDLTKRLGNFTLTGDDVVTQSQRTNPNGKPWMVPSLLVLRESQDWTVYEDPGQIRRQLDRIATGWRPLRSSMAPA